MRQNQLYKQALGFLGEFLIYIALILRGYRVLARRFRFKRREIDILAEKQGLLHIFEVKTIAQLTDPFNLIKKRQKVSLFRATRAFCLENLLYPDFAVFNAAIVHFRKGIPRILWLENLDRISLFHG